MKQTRPTYRGWVLVIIGLLMAVKLGSNVVKLWKAGERVSETQLQVEEARRENARLKQQLSDVQTPEFIEREAREKLGLGREGETVVIVPETGGSEAGPSGQMEQLPHWKQWWNLYIRI